MESLEENTFSTDKSKITILNAGAIQLTLGGSSGEWTFSNNGRVLGATAAKKLAWDSGTMTWSISISSGNATIQNTNGSYGSLLYNTEYPRFTTYTSEQTSPQLYRLTSGVTYSDYTTCGSSIVLPIELTSFTATCDGNDYFVLERSADAVNFAEVTRVAGAGNSIEPIDYVYTDYGIIGGDNYYRLVQVDYDGTRTASEIVFVRCYNADGDPDVQIYHNPFADNMTLNFRNFGQSPATIEVYDMLGKLVATRKVNCSQDEYEVVMSFDAMPSGTYCVRVSSANVVINRQVVKE